MTRVRVLFRPIPALLLLLLPLSGLAGQTITNGGFEDRNPDGPGPAAWSVGGEGYELELDTLRPHEGHWSLRIRRTGDGRFGFATQRLEADALRGRYIRLRGWIRTDSVTSGYAGLWLRFDGPGGMLWIDNMMGRGAVGTTGWTRFRVGGVVPDSATSIVLGVLLPGTGTAWFDDLSLEVLAPGERPESSDSAMAYLIRALDIMQARSVRRDSVDWGSVRSAAIQQAGGAVETKDTYAAIREALRALGDHHSFLMDPSMVTATATRTLREASGGSGPAAELLDGRIGYVMVPAYSGGGVREQEAFATEIQRLIARTDSASPCGWIVDLRQNGGGNMWPMLAGIGPLLGEGDAGAFVRPDGGRTVWGYSGGASVVEGNAQVRVAEPYELASGPATVAVLTGRVTASSGEAIVTAFRGRPATRSFGEETAGLSTANASIPLSDGAMLVLTTAVYADRTGALYGNAIVPDERVENPPAGTPLAEDATVRRAMAWLLARPSCGRR